MNTILASNILNQVTLKNGKNLKIVKTQISDAANILEYLNKVGGESSNLLFGKDEFTLTIKQEMEYIKSINDSKACMMVLGIVDSKIVSVGLLNSLPRKRIAHNSEIALSVLKSFWRNGVGSAIMNELINFAKESKSIRNITLGVKKDNGPAKLLYQKLGFSEIGVLKDFFLIDDTYYDKIIMELCI